MIAVFAVSAAAVPAVKDSADTVQAAEKVNTYIPRSMLWYNSKAAVYVKGIKDNDDLNGLFFKPKDGKEVRLDKFADSCDTKFYLRGDVVYYTLDDTLYSVKTDGSEKKTIASEVCLIGGYGSRVIFYYTKDKFKGRCYYLNSKGEIKRLNKKRKLVDPIKGVIFDGEMYFSAYTYNIAKKAFRETEIGYAEGASNRNYIYFIDDDSYGIKRVDKAGKVSNFKGCELLGINESNTIIYSDKNRNICRKTGNKKAVKAVERKNVEKLFGKNVDGADVRVTDACTVGDKLFFVAEYHEYVEKTDSDYRTIVIAQTGKNGGAVKVLDNTRRNISNGYFSCDIEAYGSTLNVCYEINDDEGTSYQYKLLNIK